jgi:hypothetical protein
MGNSASFYINLMILPENSPIPFSHLLISLIFPGIWELFVDLISIFGVAQITSLLKGVIFLIPFEEKCMSVVFHVSLVFLLLDKAEILFFEKVSLLELIFAEDVSLLDVSGSLAGLWNSLLVLLVDHRGIVRLGLFWDGLGRCVVCSLVLLLKAIFEC